jgi:hypothetical protein
MGMLLTYREGYWPDGKAPKPKRARKPRKAEKPAETPEPEASPYAELTDEQVAEAYATNVGEDAEGREAQVAALEALDAEANPAE